MTADEGVHCGFFNRITAPERLMGDALEIARRLASGPTLAHGVTKQMLHREWNMGIDAAIDAEAKAQAALMRTKDFRRAYDAFAAKKPPEFKGD